MRLLPTYILKKAQKVFFPFVIVHPGAKQVTFQTVYATFHVGLTTFQQFYATLERKIVYPQAKQITF